MARRKTRAQQVEDYLSGEVWHQYSRSAGPLFSVSVCGQEVPDRLVRFGLRGYVDFPQWVPSGTSLCQACLDLPAP